MDAEPITGPRIARAAERLIGTPFRLQGRHSDTGLDCIGLLAVCLGEDRLPDSYSVRGGSPALFARWAGQLGFVPLRRSDGPEPGDVMLVRPGAAQCHLMIVARSGLIHAHAGLGRVVATPPPSPWPVLARWRRAGAFSEEATWRP